MGMADVSFHQTYSCCGDTLQQLPIPECICMFKYWSVQVVAKYKNRYENNTQYPFYTVAVKHETGELIYDTDGNKSANNKLTSSLL